MELLERVDMELLLLRFLVEALQHLDCPGVVFVGVVIVGFAEELEKLAMISAFPS